MSNQNFEFPSWMGKFPRANSTWCDEEREELRRGWNQGLTVPQLMRKHGRGVGGIESALMDVLDLGFYEFETAKRKQNRRSDPNYSLYAQLDPIKKEIHELRDEFVRRYSILNRMVDDLIRQEWVK